MSIKAPERLDFEVSDIPEHVMKIMGMAALDLTERILRMPGGRAMLDAETAARKAAQAAKRLSH